MRTRTAHYFIHGRGRGHASRFPSARRALEEAGYQIHLHAGGDALDLVSSSRHDGPLHLRTPLLPGPLSPLRLIRRTVADAWRYGASAPDLVVSDGDQSALLASRVSGIASLAIGHDIVFSGKVQIPDLPAGPLRYQRLNLAPVNAATRMIGVHFLPTVSQDRNLRVARPEPLGLRRNLEPDEHMTCYFRDRCGADVVTMFAAVGVPLCWFGQEATPSTRVHAHGIDKPLFARALERCRAVIGSAGSNLLAECVLLSKPVFAMYRRGDSEQYLNAELVERSGIGMACAFDELNLDLVYRFVARVKADDFAKVDLESALPPLSRAVRDALIDLSGETVEPAFACE